MISSSGGTKVLAIIPARGGSKGIPRKNVRILAGKPLLVYSVEAALHARRVDRVIVTTDDDEIAQVAERVGVHVLRRPTYLADDAAAMLPVVTHALDCCEQREGPLTSSHCYSRPAPLGGRRTSTGQSPCSTTWRSTASSASPD